MAGYTPLFSKIITSSIWSEDSDTRVVWITLMAASNSKGVVEGTIPGLARLANVSIEACEKALEKFKNPDPYSRSREYEGRRIEEINGGWRLLTFIAHRKEAKKRNADWWREYRLKRKETKEKNNININNILETTYPATHLQPATPVQPVAYKLQDVMDSAILIGIEPNKAEEFYQHYNRQGWLLGNGLPITSLASALTIWRNNQFKFDRKKETAAEQVKRLKESGEL